MKKRKRKIAVAPTRKPTIKEWRAQRRAEWRNRKKSTSVWTISGGLPSLGRRR